MTVIISFKGSSGRASQGYSGGVGYSITTYRDKMNQMNDQERIIEEKKKQIEMKFVSEQKSREAQAAAAALQAKIAKL